MPSPAPAPIPIIMEEIKNILERVIEENKEDFHFESSYSYDE